MINCLEKQTVMRKQEGEEGLVTSEHVRCACVGGALTAGGVGMLCAGTDA